MSAVTGAQSAADIDVDVAVIGAGVVGCALARDLSGRALDGQPVRVALIDARGDVGDATSKANTAILHTGFDATPGTLESRLVRRGYELLAGYASDAGIPVERVGAILVAWTDEELETLPTLAAKAVKNGYEHGTLISADEVYERLPHLGPGALGGLVIPDESIICSWTSALAFATEAVRRGAHLRLGFRVEGVERDDADAWLLTGPTGQLRARWIVNAAGLGADVIDRMLGHDRFTVIPRRGELIVFDKLARPLAPHIVLPVPSSRGKGVLVSPTIYGNVMLGPTADNIEDRSDTATTESGLTSLVAKGERLMPDLLAEEITASYAGLRASTDHDDYVVACHPEQVYVLVGGIRSTGLTASMAIAEHVVLTCGGGMGGLLGPAKAIYHDLGEHLWANHGIATIRVGYRTPNHLPRCVHDVAAAGDLASRTGARRFVVLGHSFGGAVAVQAGTVLAEHCAGVVTFATQSAGCEQASALAAPLLLFHGDRDEILPFETSVVVRELAGHGEVIALPGEGHLLDGAADELRDRLGVWIPERFAAG